MEKLEGCAMALASWNRVKYEDVSKRLHSLTRKLKNLQVEQTAGDREEIIHLQGEIDHLLEMDDIKWRQRAKGDWFKGEGIATQFFHAWTTQCRRSNKIHSVLDAAGFRRSSTDAIGEAFTSYFKYLFSSEGPTEMEYCLDAMAQRVTPKKNLTLLKEFTGEEIVHALGEMQPLKALGPDGFGACFFQQH
jgi:hypothetical protein